MTGFTNSSRSGFADFGGCWPSLTGEGDGDRLLQVANGRLAKEQGSLGMALFDLFKKKTEEKLVAPPQPLPKRNDLCWCGSDNKYKNCHLEQDQQTLKKIRKQEEAQAAAARRRSAFR